MKGLGVIAANAIIREVGPGEDKLGWCITFVCQQPQPLHSLTTVPDFRRTIPKRPDLAKGSLLYLITPHGSDLLTGNNNFLLAISHHRRSIMTILAVLSRPSQSTHHPPTNAPLLLLKAIVRQKDCPCQRSSYNSGSLRQFRTARYTHLQQANKTLL